MNNVQTYIGTNKPILEVYKGIKQKIYIRFLKGEYLCSKEDENIRKYAIEFTKNLKMPIENMTCDLWENQRKHKMYYYEWAYNEKVQ